MAHWQLEVNGDSSVGIVTGLRVGQLSDRGLIPGQGKRFCSHSSSIQGSRRPFLQKESGRGVNVTTPVHQMLK